MVVIITQRSRLTLDARGHRCPRGYTRSHLACDGFREPVAGVPKVSVSLGGEDTPVWVDVFHRMAEASFHLVTGEIHAARANPLLAGMLHYRPAQAV